MHPQAWGKGGEPASPAWGVPCHDKIVHHRKPGLQDDPRIEATESGNRPGLSSASVVANGVPYGASESAECLFALHARTGEVLWTLSTVDFNCYFPMVGDGVLYAQVDEVYLIAVDAGNGSTLPWEFETGGFSDVLHYAVIDGVVYWAGSDGAVYAHAAPSPSGG